MYSCQSGGRALLHPCQQYRRTGELKCAISLLQHCGPCVAPHVGKAVCRPHLRRVVQQQMGVTLWFGGTERSTIPSAKAWKDELMIHKGKLEGAKTRFLEEKPKVWEGSREGVKVELFFFFSFRLFHLSTDQCN